MRMVTTGSREVAGGRWRDPGRGRGRTAEICAPGEVAHVDAGDQQHKGGRHGQSQQRRPVLADHLFQQRHYPHGVLGAAVRSPPARGANAGDTLASRRVTVPSGLVHATELAVRGEVLEPLGILEQWHRAVGEHPPTKPAGLAHVHDPLGSG